MLIQNEAAFVARLAETDRAQIEFQRQHLEFERRHLEFERETREHFTRLERQLAEVIRVLNGHGRILQRLPEEVRERIGFKPPQSS